MRDCARLGAAQPYEQAASAYAQLSGIALSPSTLWRLTRREGERYAGVLEGEAEAAWEGLNEEAKALPFEREAPGPGMNLSMDGTTVNVRGEGWKEVKVACVSRVSEASGQASAAEPGVRLGDSSYRAGLWGARAFEKQQWAEGLRRGLDRAECLSSVNDGARYLWEIVGNCYPHAVEVVDWWHAAQHLWGAAAAAFGAGTEAASGWVAVQKDRLWAGEVEGVLRALDALEPASEACREAVEAERTYFHHNGHRMRYADYRARGLPIGSGSVEGGGCKQVVGGRLKQAGMRWSREGASAVLALRSALFSNRWDHVWSSS